MEVPTTSTSASTFNTPRDPYCSTATAARDPYCASEAGTEMRESSTHSIGQDTMLPITSSDVVKASEREAAATRRMFRFLAAAVFALIAMNAGFQSYLIYANNIQSSVNANTNMLMNRQGDIPVATASAFDMLSIDSEISKTELSRMTSIDFIIGGNTAISLATNGFAQFPCKVDCKSPNVLHIYTADATIIYHGKQMYIGNPSNALQASLLHEDGENADHFIDITTRRLTAKDGQPIGTDMQVYDPLAQRRLGFFSTAFRVASYVNPYVRVAYRAYRVYNWYNCYYYGQDCG